MIPGLNLQRLRSHSPAGGGVGNARQGATLLVDVTCLCYRALFASISERSEVEPDQIQSFVLERFFSTIQMLSYLYGAKRYVFCFDSTMEFSYRRQVYPTYKHARKEREKSEAEIVAIREASKVIGMLRNGALKEVGFNNVCWQDGLEADDIMAWCALNFDHERMVMVTDDADLFQCLRSHVCQYRPARGKKYTMEDFIAEHEGLSPSDWALVKAMAGCSSDNVEGIQSIGEKTSIRYIRGTLPQKGVKWSRIISEEGQAIIKRNLPLVTLPHLQTKPIEYQDDVICVPKLLALFGEYGLKLLADNQDEWRSMTKTVQA